MKIIGASLALRFYVDEGWTREILESCLEKGELIFDDRSEGEYNHYYILKVGGAFNAKKLMKHVSSIHRVFNQYPSLSDEDYITAENWK